MFLEKRHWIIIWQFPIVIDRVCYRREMIREMKQILRENGIKYGCYLFYAVAFLGILLLRLYRIESVPRGLHIDEAGMAYDALCLLEGGTDRWLSSWPVYLNNTGNGQSILYCILCVLSYKIFGVSVLAIRMPAIIFSMLTLIYGTRIVRLCWKNEPIRIILMVFLYGAVPYFTQNGRYGLDCNLMLGTFTIFFYYFIKAIKTERDSYILVSGIAAGIVLYSYIISYLTLPFFLVCSFFYLWRLGKISAKKVFLFCIPLGILAFPLILVQVVNIFQLEDIRLGIFSINKLGTYRSSEFVWNNVIHNLFQTIKCMIRDGELIFDAFPNYGTLYILSIPFVFIGGVYALIQTIRSIRDKTFCVYFFILCWIAAMVILGCFLGGDGPLTYRFNAVFFFLLLLTVEGILRVINFTGKFKYAACGIIFAAYSMFFLSFIRYYFFIYPDEVYPQYGFEPDLFEVVEYNGQHEEELKDYQLYLCLNHAPAEFYGLAAHVSPEAYFTDGIRDVSHCGEVIFVDDTIQEIDENGVYIVWEVYRDLIDRLESLGFLKKSLGDYVYMVPLSTKAIN